MSKTTLSLGTWLTDDSLAVPPEILALLDQGILTSQNYLHSLAEDSAFSTKMATVFGENTESEYSYQNFQEEWLNNDFSILSRIEIRTPEDLGGAKGAYSAQTDTIYLSLAFLIENQHNVEAIAFINLVE